MTDFTFPPAWERALDDLEVTPDDATTPSGEQGEWGQALMRFTTRGFLMCYLKPRGDRVAMRLDVALPEAERTAGFSRELASRFEALGAKTSEVKVEGPPAILKAEFPPFEDETDDAVAIMTLVLQVADFVSAMEDDAEAPSPLETAPETDTTAEEDADDQEEATFSGFESIGTGNDDTEVDEASLDEEDASAPPEDDEASTADAPAAPRGAAFESIGTGAASEQSDSAPSDGAGDEGARAERLVAFDLWATDSDVRVVLGLDGARAKDVLRHGLARMLRTRFDAQVESVHDLDDHRVEEVPADQLISFILTPGLTTATREDVDRLADDLGHTFERLREFGELGMTLRGVLDLPDADEHSAPDRDTSHTERDAARERFTRTSSERTTRTDLPSVRRVAQRAADETDDREDAREEPPATRDDDGEEGAGFVLDLDAASQAPSPSNDGEAMTLRQGNFTDPNLKRADAATQLVDVVLRHPGYSERNISQVLSILLSIEYARAQKLGQQAPCVIAWGIGRERAHTFKNVIEGTGGKVLLTEPGTFENEL